MWWPSSCELSLSITPSQIWSMLALTGTTEVRREDIQRLFITIHYLSPPSVTDVWVAGHQLVKDEKVIGMNEAALLRKAQQWGEKIKATKLATN